MKNSNEKLEQLKSMIDLMLDDCDRYTYPHVCNMASMPETRKELQDMIIDVTKNSGVSVGKAIDQIERAYNPNMIED